LTVVDTLTIINGIETTPLMTNKKPKTEQEFREWIRTLIKEVKEEKKKEAK